MKNIGQIHRSKKNGKSRYTPISNDILQSKILTPEQKSILVHLLSLPEDWIVYKTEIWKNMNIGRDRFNKALTVLVGLVYIVSIRMIKSNGQLEGYNHIVYEEPVIQTTETQLTENQYTGNQSVNKVIRKQSNKIQNNNLKSNNILDTSTSIENLEIDMFSKEAQDLAEQYFIKMCNPIKF
jgi:hypothetical protein